MTSGPGGEALRACGLLRGFEPGEVGRIAAAGRFLDAPDGTVEPAAGADDDCLLVVLRGEVEVERAGHASTAGPGAALGALALLRGAPRTATVRVRGDARVFLLPRAGFAPLLAEWDRAACKPAVAIARSLAERLCGRGDQLSELCRCARERSRRPPRRDARSPGRGGAQ